MLFNIPLKLNRFNARSSFQKQTFPATHKMKENQLKQTPSWEGSRYHGISLAHGCGLAPVSVSDTFSGPSINVVD